MSSSGVSNHREDATDERILRLLVRNARLSFRQIGASVGLSANAVAQRMRRLEAAGVIRGYTARLDPRRSRQPTHDAVLHICTAPGADDAALEAGFADIPSAVEVLDLAGTIDYEVRLRCPNQEDLYDAVQTIRQLPGIVSVETRPVLRHVLRR